MDSPSFESKNKLGTRLAMLCQRCQSRADVSFGGLRRLQLLRAHRANNPFREPRRRLNPHRRRPAPRGSVQKIVSEVPNTPCRACGARLRHFRYNPLYYATAFQARRHAACCMQAFAKGLPTC